MTSMIQKVADRYLSKAAGPNALTGLTKPVGLRRINAVIAKAHLQGLFRDAYWTPIQRLWQDLAEADIPVAMTGTQYGKNDQGVPNSKTWTFTIEWEGPNGRPILVYGRVVVSGAGSVRDPLDAYDVVAYVS